MTLRAQGARVAGRLVLAGSLLAAIAPSAHASVDAPGESPVGKRPKAHGSAAYTRDSWQAAGMPPLGGSVATAPPASAAEPAESPADAVPGLTVFFLAALAAAAFVLGRRGDH